MVGGIRRVLLDSMRRWKRDSEATLGNATCGVCVHAMHVVCTMHSEANAVFQTQEHHSKNIVHNAHCTVKPIQHSRLINTAQVALSSLQWAMAHVQSHDFFGGLTLFLSGGGRIGPPWGRCSFVSGDNVLELCTFPKISLHQCIFFFKNIFGGPPEALFEGHGRFLTTKSSMLEGSLFMQIQCRFRWWDHTCLHNLGTFWFQNFEKSTIWTWAKLLSTRIRDIVPLIVHTKFQVDILITFWIIIKKLKK